MKHAAESSSPSRLPPTACAVLLLSLFFTSGQALANDYASVNELLRTGQSAAALAKATAYVQAHPRDPQMRFLRGVILSETGQVNEAAALFTQLTQDYPELPEPYNNLAAIHASRGDLDAARQTLESAVRLNPNYATAHENLGDVYASMAIRQYERAQRLASTSASAGPKAASLRELLNPSKSPASRGSK